MSATSPDPLHWFDDRSALERWVRDAVLGEWEHLRPQGIRWPQRGTAPARDVHWVDDLGLDSLEAMVLSTGFAELLGIEDPQALWELHERPSWWAWTDIAQRHLQAALASGAPGTAATPGTAQQRFRSSGSSGKTHLTNHALADLLEEMEAVATLWESAGQGTASHASASVGSATPGKERGSAPGRIVCTVRSHHIYGFLFSQLLPLVLHRRGLGPVAVVDAVGLPPAWVRATLQPGDCVVAFPDWWQWALQSAAPWPSGVWGFTSTSPCPAELRQRMADVGLQVCEIYGSSETAGVGWRWVADADFTLHAHWKRGADGSLLRPQAQGARRHALPDRLDWSDDRHFRPLGRLDGQVQVAGHNVDLQQVRAVLLDHPEVQEAAVRLHEYPRGPALKAFIVPKALAQHDSAAQNASDTALDERLRRWCSSRLRPVERPVDWQFGQQLPRSSMGKARDWSVAATH